MRKNQKGFSIVEILLILVIIALISLVGGYVWHSKKNATSVYNAIETSKNVATQQSSMSYLIIKEWNIKIKALNADKLTYDGVNCGNPYCSVDLRFKPSVTTDRNCNFVAEILSNSQEDSTATKKLGKSYYGVIDDSRLGYLDFSKCNNAVNSLRNATYKSITADSFSGIE